MEESAKISPCKGPLKKAGGSIYLYYISYNVHFILLSSRLLCYNKSVCAKIQKKELLPHGNT